jgi:hypothetical protein
MPAIRANHVRRLLRAALRAGLKLLRLKSIVRTTHAGARIRLLTFGYTHGRYLPNTRNSLVLLDPSAYDSLSKPVKGDPLLGNGSIRASHPEVAVGPASFLGVPRNDRLLILSKLTQSQPCVRPVFAHAFFRIQNPRRSAIRCKTRRTSSTRSPMKPGLKVVGTHSTKP